ncbi:MAG: amidohydrolase family protein [Thermodesulfobacteriota bacterium]|nr:amidohydrolase family protein [Thermodesulfobacteriota bacterium]
MIIDVHYHFIRELSEHTLANLIKYSLHAAKIMGRDIDPNRLMKKAIETWLDPTGENLIASMDEAGIDITVICLVDNIDNPQYSYETMQEGNKIIASIARKFPNRIIAFAGVDPRRPNAREMLKECFEEFGVKGLKYHPDHGYNPSEPESYKVLEILAENRGVLLSHTGPLMPPSRCKYADPMLLADLAVDFPEMNVIAAHMGAINWRSWANLAAHQPTLYGDLAMWDAYAFGHYELFCRELRDIIDYTGITKVLFGTDGPIFSLLEPTKNWINLIRSLPENAPEGIHFTDEEVKAILGGNARSVLALD